MLLTPPWPFGPSPLVNAGGQGVGARGRKPVPYGFIIHHSIFIIHLFTAVQVWGMVRFGGFLPAFLIRPLNPRCARAGHRFLNVRLPLAIVYYRIRCALQHPPGEGFGGDLPVLLTPPWPFGPSPLVNVGGKV